MHIDNTKNGNVGSDSACMGKTQPELIFFGRQEAN